MFVTQAVVRIIIGPDDRRFFDGERFLIKASEFKEMTGLNEGLALKSTQVMTIFITIVLVSLLFWFLNKTKTGKSMKAYSDNEDLALLSGIDPKRIVMITWIIAGILATIGGVLYGLDKSFKPFTYFNNMLPIFAAAIVGGIGNPFGAFLGGYVIAFSEIFLTYAYKKFLIYVLPESMEPESLVQLLSTDYKFAVSFSILVLVLLYRPSGIFKGKVL
jgi:branched-chain amino acid transport system permease protein